VNAPSSRPTADRPFTITPTTSSPLLAAAATRRRVTASASGQTASLSLFASTSDFDYHATLSRRRGRRLFPASPREQPVFDQGGGQVAHAAQAPDDDGESYQTLLHWIKQAFLPL